MTSQKQQYWFPAKRYGWGWGPPSAWQGWVVLFGYLLLNLVGLFLLQLSHQVLLFVLYQLVLAAALITVCIKRGEPTRWRWGDKS